MVDWRMVLVRVMSESAEIAEKLAKKLLQFGELANFEHVGSGKIGVMHSVDLQETKPLKARKVV